MTALADATCRVPEHGQVVWLHGRRYDREPLQVAYRLLQDFDVEQAKAAMREAGWDRVACGYVDAAARWTGRVVRGDAS